MNWTEGQRQTIETRNKNILVSAAAGSGKTAVLIERIKQLILKDKTDLDRFLITTFTNAAAAEMKERLEKAIREELKNPEADKAFLKRQINLMGKANISTFHTFSLEIMRRYFYLTDLEPGFKIGDEIQVSLLKNEAVDQLFEERFEDDYESFTAFLKKYSSDRSEKKIKDNILSIYKELRSVPHYLQWAKERAELLNTPSPMEALGLTGFILGQTARKLEESADLYERAAGSLEDAGIDSLCAKAEQDAERVREAAVMAKAAVEAFAEKGADEQVSEKLEQLKGFLSDPGFQTMRATKAEKEDYDQIKEQVGNLRKKGRKIIKDLDGKFFQRSFVQYDEELRESYEDTMYFTGLIEDFEKLFREKKREKNLVDFDDAMHYAIDILQDPMASAEYRERFRYIFVDEFQDSNMLQEAILEKIAGEDNLFMVGDVKQSIYKFRLAEPELFKRKYALYKSEDETRSTKIDLNSNFRSKYNVTRTVNAVFSDIMEDYDEDAKLHCTIDRAYPGEETELHIISRTGSQEPESESAGGADNQFLQQGGPEQIRQELSETDETEEMESAELEAALIARLIRRTEGEEIYDAKADRMRTIGYGDIAVLSRNKTMIGEIERYLNNAGIPAFGESTGSYFESVEIQVFLNLLRVIDNTRQDIPLLSVMRSVIFAFGVRELASIRIACKDGSFYNAIRQYEKEGENMLLREKISRMMERLSYWKQLCRTVTLEELVRTLLYDTGYFDYCSGLPVGHQRISNLRLLIRKAAEFEDTNYSGLSGFLAYVEAMKRGNLAVGEARTVGENENVVRVMTVHKSKGLEFPVVILAGAGRDIRFRGFGSSTVMHKDFAIAMPRVNREEHWHRKTILQRAIEARKTEEELEEEIRILYVAMTRAMDRLVITSAIKDAEKLDADDRSKGSFLKMLYPAFASTEEKVQIHYGNRMLQTEAFDSFSGTGMDPALRDRLMYGAREGEEASYQQADRDTRERIEEISAKLSFVYPHDRRGTKLKYSVTELNRRDGEEKHLRTLTGPAFALEERRPGAAALGTAMHLVMEKLDFRRALDQGKGYIGMRADQLVAEGFLTEEERLQVDEDAIAAFFMQPEGKRAAMADSLQKEREFILQKEIEGEEAIVQGIIDCYFEEEDGLVLIDYKNSRLGRDADQEQVVREYRQQLALYREALEAATGRQVKEMYLYLFRYRKFLLID
ncbi:MAG: helicase-exonuclease AddAB subunit AddA [Bacillota bacterium]|nr:helicase-exonuclease AddAB subunit AddA [Bacillota bacterium]